MAAIPGAQASENPGTSTDKTVEEQSRFLSRLKSHAPSISAVGVMGLLALGAYDQIVIPIQDLKTKAATQTEQLGNLSEKVEDLDRDVAEVESELQTDFDELTKSIHSVDIRLTAVETSLEDVGERLSEVSAEVRVLGNEVREHEHRSAIPPGLRNTVWSEGEFVQP